MEIANPIYDVVFKYLMEDSKIAKLLISSIIRQEIEILDFRPQEFTAEIEKQKVVKRKKTKKKSEGRTFFTIYRLDFSAKIKTPDGDKIVLIEIQKAKFATDIMRFREYLGTQYSNKENVYVTVEKGKRVKKACELISIYFLGHQLENIRGVPIIKSQKKYIDVSTGEEIKEREYFIDSLNHESYTIPIPELKEKRRNELEMLLSVFDQTNITSDQHILNVREEDFPERFRELVRRLQKAASVPDIRKKMNIEDEIIEELAEREREIAVKEILIEEQGKTIRRFEDILDEKEQILAEKDEILAEKDKVLAEKDRILAKQEEAITQLSGISAQQGKMIEELQKAIEALQKR